MRCAYQGQVPVSYPDYIDLGTGRILTVEPGGFYDVTPASGRPVPDLPAGFAPAVGDEVFDIPVQDDEPEGGEG